MKQIFEIHRLGAQPLPFIFHNVTISDCEMENNWHVNIELIYFTKGKGIALCDNEPIEVEAGDIVIVDSGMPHAFHSTEGMSYYCLIPDAEFCRTNSIDTSNLEFERLIKSDEARALYDKVVSEFGSSNMFRECGIIASVLSLILYIARNHTKTFDSTKQTAKEEGIRIAVSYIYANMQQKITLDTLASVSGFSKYYFSREFKKSVGLTPVEFLNLARCEYAKKLLKSDKLSICEISEKCGFEDMSYFGKVFKKFYGVSPAGWRKNTIIKI